METCSGENKIPLFPRPLEERQFPSKNDREAPHAPVFHKEVAPPSHDEVGRRGFPGIGQNTFEGPGISHQTHGFDLSPATVEAIKGGWTDLVIDQQQWLQGYLSVLQICLTDNYAFTGLNIDTGAGFAHADNVDLLEALVAEQIR